MSKLNFTPKPTSQEVEDFIDFIEYNRSQRNKDKDFLMTQFECGNIFMNNGAISVRNSKNHSESEFGYINQVINKVVVFTPANS